MCNVATVIFLMYANIFGSTSGFGNVLTLKIVKSASAGIKGIKIELRVDPYCASFSKSQMCLPLVVGPHWCRCSSSWWWLLSRKSSRIWYDRLQMIFDTSLGVWFLCKEIFLLKKTHFLSYDVHLNVILPGALSIITFTSWSSMSTDNIHTFGMFLQLV